MKLALGTVQFGLPYGIANQSGQVTLTEAKSMLELASTNGIDTLDTAIAYGDSEACLGQIGVPHFNLVTKLPSAPDGCTDIGGWVKGQMEASLARLGVRSVYGLLLHRSEQLLHKNGKELYLALQDLKEKGLVRKIGVSIYSPNDLELIIKLFRLDLVQAPFNLVDRRLHTTGWLKRLKEEGVEIHTRSVFLQGLLLMSQLAIPQKFAPWRNIWSEWHKWLSERNISAVQACLTYPLAFPEIERVVVGADSIIQLKQIIEAVAGGAAYNLPDLQCDSENLINPARWSQI